MNSEIVFLGTSHIDPKGYERTSRILDALHPHLIVLEVSRFALLFRKTLGVLFRKRLEGRINQLHLNVNRELEYTLQYFSLPYEYRAAKEYGCAEHARVILIDSSLFSFFRLMLSFRMTKKENLRSLESIEEDRFVRERILAEGIFNSGDSIVTRMKLAAFEKDSLIRARERILSKRVTRILARHREKKICYIGGWEHLIDDEEGRTLYSNITAPKKRIILFLD